MILVDSSAWVECDRLRRLLYGQEFLAVEGPANYEQAADLYGLCAVGGDTPRQLADCLIAVVAISQ